MKGGRRPRKGRAIASEHLLRAYPAPPNPAPGPTPSQAHAAKPNVAFEAQSAVQGPSLAAGGAHTS